MTSAIRKTSRENIWARFGKRRSYMKLCETMFFFKKKFESALFKVTIQ